MTSMTETCAPASAITRRREAEVDGLSLVPVTATTMVAVAPSRTMTPVSTTSPLSASTAITTGSSRTVCAGTST